MIGYNVCSLVLCDVDMDGKNKVIVRSEDFAIRMWQNDQLMNSVWRGEGGCLWMWEYEQFYVHAHVQSTLYMHARRKRMLI